MKGTTRERKKAIRGIEEGLGRQWVLDQMHQLSMKNPAASCRVSKILLP